MASQSWCHVITGIQREAPLSPISSAMKKNWSNSLKKMSANRDKNVEEADRMCACHATLLAPCPASSSSINCVAKLLLLCLAAVWIRSRKFESQSVLYLRKNQFPCQWGRWLRLVNIDAPAVTRRPPRPPLFLFLGRLRGLDQSKPGGAPDDPRPAGRVEGSARTPVAVHVSCRHSVIDVRRVITWVHFVQLFSDAQMFCYSFTQPFLASDAVPKVSSQCRAQDVWQINNGASKHIRFVRTIPVATRKNQKYSNVLIYLKGKNVFFNATCRKIHTFSFCIFILWMDK